MDMGALDNLAKQILEDAVTDFADKRLGTDSLSKEYAGAAIAVLETKYCNDGPYSKVDFDLALKQLEEGELVKTGPMTFFENKPASRLVILATYSKREYVYLTEKGYRAAQRKTGRRPSSSIPVNISGNFYHSTIGVGESVTQTISFNDPKDLDSLRRLVEVFEKHIDELALDAAARRKAMAQVATIKAQLEDEPNSAIVKQAGLTLRNITEGAIAGLLSTAVQPAVWAWVSANMGNLFR
jgi:hypothetical protein